MIWKQVIFESLNPLTNPFFEEVKKIYGDDWNRWCVLRGKDLVWILEKEKELLGFYKIKETEKGIKICSLLLDYSIRGQGIGKSVIKNVLEKKKRVYCTIWEKDIVTRNFLEHLGFTSIDIKTKTGIKEIVYENNITNNEKVV